MQVFPKQNFMLCIFRIQSEQQQQKQDFDFKGEMSKKKDNFF